MLHEETAVLDFSDHPLQDEELSMGAITTMSGGKRKARRKKRRAARKARRKERKAKKRARRKARKARRKEKRRARRQRRLKRKAERRLRKKGLGSATNRDVSEITGLADSYADAPDTMTPQQASTSRTPLLIAGAVAAAAGAYYWFVMRD